MNVEYERVFEPEWGVARREPSDVVAVDGTYYCWYTRVEDDDPAYPGAYGGTVWYATSPDGHVWTERGEALPAGGAGAWDEYGAFTSNVFVADGTYYLFYTGVPAPFSAEFEDATETAIGVATADAPEGPWTKRGRVLEPGESGAWDDFRVDDACVVEHRGEYLLYYKGATKFQDNWAAHTPHGLAVAEDPAGPYERSPYNPVYDRATPTRCSRTATASARWSRATASGTARTAGSSSAASGSRATPGRPVRSGRLMGSGGDSHRRNSNAGRRQRAPSGRCTSSASTANCRRRETVAQSARGGER
jgi:hypothetical protein